ncbi:M12 family metallo-peptidase [Pseudomonas plecoglossicida]|uniref:M12 family metallo-peptidase n=1 Tax=Pseudomonas plecoglossicida TaxID=70775 RepID=UPI003D1EB5E8
MRKLTIGVGLLAIAALFWMARTTSTDFLSTGQGKAGPQAAWVSKQWSANVAVDALTQSTEKLELSLADQYSLTAHRSQAFRREDGTLVWYGSLSDAGQAAPAAGTLTAATNGIVLVLSNGQVSGSLRWNGQVFRLLPASDGYVLEQVDGAKLPPDHASDDAPIASASQATGKPQPHEPGHATVRVLIVGTKNAGEAHEDLQALAHLAIEESNLTYLNSGIDMSLELAAFRQLDYEQHSSSPDIDLRRLVAPADGFMDDVHQMRDELKADVVVLLVDTIMEACGRASARPATADTAFAYVNLKCVGVWRFTTGHEIAHLQGASHEYFDDDDGPFVHGHGFIHEPENEPGWRTVMATVEAANSVRVPFWSDPERLMDGVPMGDARTADNRRLLEETKWTVAGFR